MSKSTKQLMAEYIKDTAGDCCSVCAWEKECSKAYEEAEQRGEVYEPNNCVSGIIYYFESQNGKNNKK